MPKRQAERRAQLDMHNVQENRKDANEKEGRQAMEMQVRFFFL